MLSHVNAMPTIDEDGQIVTDEEDEYTDDDEYVTDEDAEFVEEEDGEIEEREKRTRISDELLTMLAAHW